MTSSTEQKGVIATFYSYKGGTGRSMALANTACLLGRQLPQNSGSVLVIDWDLEAPGLHHYFPAAKDPAYSARLGLIDYFWKLRELLDDGFLDAVVGIDGVNTLAKLMPLEDYIIPGVSKGVDLIRAGFFSPNYQDRVASFDWAEFYKKYRLAFRTFREYLSSHNQWCLIDSRTGLSDISGICTMLMPEKLIVAFTPNRQSLDGVLDLAEKAIEYRRSSDDLRPLSVFPLPSRLVMEEHERRRDATNHYTAAFEDLFRRAHGLINCDLTHYFREVGIPHHGFYAFNELVAVRDDPTATDALSINRAFERFCERLSTLDSAWEDLPDRPIRVYLAHSSKDKPFVRELALFLPDSGQIDIWLDEAEIQQGDSIVAKIQNGLDVDVVLFIMSPDSIASNWLKEEYTDAYWEQVNTGHVKLVGVLYRECLIPRLIRNKKNFDLRTNQLDGFRQIKAWLLSETRAAGEKQVEKSESWAKLLFERLGYLPIGISVAAGLVKQDVRYTMETLAKKLPPLEKLRYGKDNVGQLLTEAIAAPGASARTLLHAMAVCAPEGFRLWLASEVAELDEETALDSMQELKSRSLVEELDRETRRYRLQTLVRSAAGPADDLQLRHARAMSRRFEEWEKNWRECEQDLPDLKEALTWGLEGGEDRERWALSGQLGYGGYSLCLRIGRIPEAFEFCEQGAQAAEARGDKWALQAWYGNQALILQDWGRPQQALALQIKQEAICQELGDRDGLQRSFGNQALILKAWGRLEEALALHKKEEAICRELSDRDGLQASYGNQALILQAWGRLEEALALLKEQEAICQELGNRDGLQASYGNQALILQAWGRLEEALALLKKQEAICQELGSRDGLQASYGNQAFILQAWGRPQEALALHKKEEAICKELGNRQGLADCYWHMGDLARARGDLPEARTRAEKSLAIFTELNMPKEIEWTKGLLEEIKRGDPPSMA